MQHTGGDVGASIYSLATRLWSVFLAASLAIAACGTNSADYGSSDSARSISPRIQEQAQAMTEGPEGTLTAAQDSSREMPMDEEGFLSAARLYAADVGVSVEEATRRLRLMHTLGNLTTRLEAGEGDTFAGLWWQHQPEFRLIVAFTRGGEETIRPYIEGEPYEGIVEVRRVEATHAELLAVREEAQRLLDRLRDRLDREVIANIHTSANRVEIPVVHRDQFDRALRESGMRLPEHVAVIAEAGRSLEPGRGRATAVSPRPATQIRLPTGEAEEPGGPSTQVPLSGELVERDGCLRVRVRRGTGESYVIVWPRGFRAATERGEIVVLDSFGRVAARVGERLDLGGKHSAADQPPRTSRGNPTAGCPGPYFAIGGVPVR